MANKEKVNRVFSFEDIYNGTEKSLEIDTQYNSLTLEGKKLTFQSFDFSDIKEFIFSGNLEIKRIKKDDSNGDVRLYAMPTTIEKITSQAVPNESDSQQLCLISKIEEIVFKDCILNALKIDKDSNIKKLTLNESVVKDRFEILEKEDFEYLDLTGSTFEDFVDFSDSAFEKTVLFKDTTFEAGAAFVKCKFNGKTDFTYTSFEDKSFFNEAEFLSEINLETATFYKDVDFLKIKTEVANRETARKIKDSFEKQNNIIEANKFYALEMEEREKELTKDINKGKNIFEWLIFKAHAISSNHSQDPILALCWIIVFGITASLYEIKFSCISSFGIINMIIIDLFIIAPIIINRTIEQKFDKYTKNYLSVLSALSLIFIAINCSPTDYENTMSFAKTINPFSIMTSKEPITFGLLLFKVTIAYLIYQFIVSVRQNTRRK